MRLQVLPEKEPWYADGLKFTCTQCGNCCTGAPGYVWISEVEIGRLAEHLHLSRDEVISRYCRIIGDRISLSERRSASGNYDCIFLHEQPAAIDPQHPDRIPLPKRTCSIYAVRPLQCRTWPFWDGLLASRENWDRAGQRCPGINRGKHYPLQRIAELRDAKDWPKSPPGSSDR